TGAGGGAQRDDRDARHRGREHLRRKPPPAASCHLHVHPPPLCRSTGSCHERPPWRRVRRDTSTAPIKMPPWIICTTGPVRFRMVSPVPTICRYSAPSAVPNGVKRPTRNMLDPRNAAAYAGRSSPIPVFGFAAPACELI